MHGHAAAAELSGQARDRNDTVFCKFMSVKSLKPRIILESEKNYYVTCAAYLALK